jgi:hypothetical protein
MTRGGNMRSQHMTGTKRVHSRNGAPAEARDKILATTALLRDNAVVGTPEMVAPCCQGRQLAAGTEGTWLAVDVA